MKESIASQLRATSADVIAVDPGINNLGVCVANFEQDYMFVKSVDTYSIRKLIDKESHVDAPILDRQLEAVSTLLTNLILQYNPYYFVGELQVQGKNVLAYGKQHEGLNSLRSAIWRAKDVSPDTMLSHLHLVHPGDVKEVLGISRTDGDKEKIKLGTTELIASDSIQLADDIDVDSLSEHALDAIVIAYLQYRNV